MTREAVRAEQDDAARPIPILTRVTISAIDDQTVTVQLPGGSSVVTPRIAGAIYQVGASGFATVQEPAIGPVTQIGSAAIGKAIRVYCTNAVNFASQSGTPIPMGNTVFNDSANTYEQAGNGIRVKADGLYHISFWAAFSNVQNASNLDLYLQQRGSTIQESSGYCAAGFGIRVIGQSIVHAQKGDVFTLNAYSSNSAGTVAGSADQKDVGMSAACIGQ